MTTSLGAVLRNALERAEFNRVMDLWTLAGLQMYHGQRMRILARGLDVCDDLLRGLDVREATCDEWDALQPDGIGLMCHCPGCQS